jgi:hypothetical protein
LQGALPRFPAFPHHSSFGDRFSGAPSP